MNEDRIKNLKELFSLDELDLIDDALREYKYSSRGEAFERSSLLSNEFFAAWNSKFREWV